MGGYVISTETVQNLRCEAAASPGAEICGLLFGSEDRIERAQATRNVAPDPAVFFEIDPSALIAAHRAQRAGGPRLIGHYHSHPSGRAEPSPRDAADAAPGSLWLIVTRDGARLWQAGDSGFIEVNLIFADLAP